MEININSAYRIHKLLSELSYKDGKQVLEAWTDAFHIKHESASKKALMVSECLNALDLELSLFEEQATGRLRPEVLEKHVTRVREAINPILFPASWNVVKQYLPADTILIFEVGSDMLPNEEALISDSDLNDLLSLVNDLESSLEAGTLPSSLKMIIRRHIQRIREAIAVYPVCGVKALRSALHEAMVDVACVSEELEAEQSGDNSGTIEQLRRVWYKARTTIESADTVIKLIELGGKFWTAISG